MTKLLGGILLAVGVLIAGVSGLCTVIAVGMSASNPSDSGFVGVALLVGGIPFVIGAFLIWLGRIVIKSDQE